MLDTIRTRPVAVVAFITALHSIIYGFGFIADFGGFQQTVLYKNIATIGGEHVFGWVVLLSGLSILFAMSLNNQKAMAWASTVQTMCWLFTTISYAFNGQLMLGLGVAFMWVLLSSYVAWCYANRDLIIQMNYLRYRKMLNDS